MTAYRAMFPYLKALHIIFVITWFAGLFYIVRLFIYHTEALAKDEPARSILTDQFKLMAQRLWYIITWPSAVLTLILGLWLLHAYGFNIPLWLWIKLGFVLLLYLYHLKCHQIFRKLQRNEKCYTSQQLRLWNEVTTLLLVAIIFLVVLKSTLNMVGALLSWIALGIVLMIGITLYKKFRMQ